MQQIHNIPKQVLVSKGNQALLPAGQYSDTLVPGQIGVFDRETNLSIGPGTIPKDFYIIVGGNTPETETQTAGEKIHTKGLVAYEPKVYTAPAVNIIEVSGFQSLCETEYIMKVESRNQETSYLQNPNKYIETFGTVTGTCDGCVSCPSTDANVLVKKLYNIILANEPEYFTVELLDNLGVLLPNMAAIDAFIATNATVNTDSDPTNDVVMRMRFTSIPVKKNPNPGNIDYAYYYPRQTQLRISFPIGFNGSEIVTIIQDEVSEQGSGYDVRYDEYKVVGYNNRPGAHLKSHFTIGREGHLYYADINENYNTFSLTYIQTSQALLNEWKYSLQSVIAIPTTDATTLANFSAILDPIKASVGL